MYLTKWVEIKRVSNLGSFLDSADFVVLVNKGKFRDKVDKNLWESIYMRANSIGIPFIDINNDKSLQKKVFSAFYYSGKIFKSLDYDEPFWIGIKSEELKRSGIEFVNPLVVYMNDYLNRNQVEDEQEFTNEEYAVNNSFNVIYKWALNNENKGNNPVSKKMLKKILTSAINVVMKWS